VSQLDNDLDGQGDVCDADDDNDGVLDGADCAPTDNTKWRSALLFIDADGDGYTVGTATICYGATVPAGYKASSSGNDCNDGNAAIKPGATEICGNGIDENCNGNADDICSNAITVSIADATVLESAGTASITINLSRAATSTVSLKYKTSNGTAKSNNPFMDYVGTAGSGVTLTFNPGQVSKTINVTIINDIITEGSENFYVKLSSLSANATFSDDIAIVTITESILLTRPANSEVKNTSVANESKLVIPNPQRKQDPLRFLGNTAGKFDVLLSDMNGKVVASLKNYRNNWSMSTLASGIYVYQVIYINEKGELLKKTGKLVITD
jgi:hypothetical protein